MGVPHAVYTDYLGNILTLTDASGTIVAQQNFDARGRRRNINNWTDNNMQAVPVGIYRGYTGHEGLEILGITNMNARLYDPYKRPGFKMLMAIVIGAIVGGAMSAATGGNVWEGIKFGVFTGFVSGEYT